MELNTKIKEPLTFYYDDLIVGGNLEALLFSYTFNFPLVYSLPIIPFPFEKHPEIGSKMEMWQNLHFLMSLAGKIPFANSQIELTYIDKETIKVVTDHDNKFYIKFKKLWVFDDICINDFPIVETHIVSVEAIDRFRVLDSWNPECLDIYRDTPIINSIHFFKKNVNNKKQKYKYFYVISKINFDEYDKVPEYFIKIKCEQILKCDKIEHIDRTTRVKMPSYQDFDNVVFCNATFEEMYPFAHKRKKITYQKYLKLKLKL